MKKLMLILFVIFTSIVLISCNKEYSGKVITKISFQTVDYNGGYTNNKVLDFVTNQYLSNGYFPSEEQEPALDEKKIFTDIEEKEFIHGCYNNGLFHLKEKYERDGIIDGGGWTLTIEYEDGSSKVSVGINNSPSRIFDQCSTYFYDLCGEQVLGNLPDYYYNPPEISYTFYYTNGEYGSGSDNSIARVSRANYKWNKSEENNYNLYFIHEISSYKNQFLVNHTYQLILYTANYDCKEKFTKIMITSYDYNRELTNEKEVYQSGWIKQIEIDLELNKIYQYVLEYKDGDFVTYTFHTKSINEKILFGEYHYPIYEEGSSKLVINQDGTYELFQFEYFDASKNINESIVGEYQFETINGKEYLCLYTEDSKRLVLEPYSRSLYIHFELCTFDLASYHIESKLGQMNGLVEYTYWD